MSKLQKTKWRDVDGWQWEDGPIFIGEKGRGRAVDYGLTTMRLAELTDLAELEQKQEIARREIAILKEYRDRK